MPSVEPRIRCDSVQGHSPAPHPLGLERDVAARGDDQRQGQLGRRHRRVAVAGRDRNAELGGGGEIDHVRVAADQRDQLELGQPLQQRARELDPLADRHHHVGVLQPLDELVEIARRLAIALHVVVADQREARKLIDHVLVVVGDDDFHRVGFPVRFERSEVFGGIEVSCDPQRRAADHLAALDKFVHGFRLLQRTHHARPAETPRRAPRDRAIPALRCA